MKKIYKKLGTVGIAVLPTSTILSCAEIIPTDPDILNPEQSRDQAIVKNAIDKIQVLSENPKIDNEKAELRSQKLPSEVTSPTIIKDLINEEYFITADSDSLTSINVAPESFNDVTGQLTVQFTVSRGQFVETTNITFNGFLNINKKTLKEDVSKIIDEIKMSPGIVNDDGKKVLPSTIKTQIDLEQKITNFFTTWKTGAIKIVAEPQNSSDEEGTLDVQFTVSEGEISKVDTVTYYGFLTVQDKTEKEDRDVVNNNVNNISKEMVVNKNASEIFASKIKTETDLEKYVSLPNITEGVTLTSNGYIPDDKQGTLSVTYNLSKGIAKGEVIVLYTGFAQTTAAKKAEFSPNVYGGWSQKINDTHYLIGTYTDGVYQVEVNPTSGDVVQSKQVPMSKNGGYNQQEADGTGDKPPVFIPSVAFGWIEQINEKHYLIGTEKEGVWQVTVDPVTGYVTDSGQVPMTGENREVWIPDVNSGFAIKVAETKNYYHYLIGTSGKNPVSSGNLLKIKVARSGPKEGQVVWTSYYPGSKIIPPVVGGWAEKINDSKYLIGTLGEGILQISVESDYNGDNIKIYRTDYGGLLSTFSDSQGWIQHIEGSHYLIGTNQSGVYQVEINQVTGLIVPGSEKQVPLNGENSIPQVNTGWIQKLDSAHYLIGTHDQGVYRVKVNPENGQVVTASPIPTSGEFSIPDVAGGFSQEVNQGSNFFIGTTDQGLYQLRLDPDWIKA